MEVYGLRTIGTVHLVCNGEYAASESVHELRVSHYPSDWERRVYGQESVVLKDS